VTDAEAASYAFVAEKIPKLGFFLVPDPSDFLRHQVLPSTHLRALVSLPQTASDAFADAVREVAMFAFTEAAVTSMAVPKGLATTPKHVIADPAVRPFALINEFLCRRSVSQGQSSCTRM
jgi:hypothetical protein